MKFLPTTIAFVTGFIAVSHFTDLAAQEAKPEKLRNPYIELGSTFEYAKSGDPLIDWASVREWTAADGRKLKAKILSVDGENGQFLLPGNREIPIPVSRFSEEDQRFIREWQEISRFFNPGYTKSRNVTGTIEAGISDGAFAKKGTEHETRHFRFVSDEALNANTVKDFSRLFEATYTLVRSLPIGLEVVPPHNGKFLVRLFSSKSDYHRAGGPETSAGVYILSSREILVPFSSLGLQRAGNSWRKASAYDPSTLIHETTHAVTHQWLPYMPLWVAEGLAEYVAAIPYRDGTFYLKELEEGLQKLVATNFGGDAHRFDLLAPKEFVYLSADEFMDRTTEPEKPIELVAVEPFQIRYITEPEPSPVVAQTEMIPSEVKPMGFTITGMSPPIVVPIEIKQPSPIVAQRYSSSMMLLHRLISEGQIENFRKFLFAQLHHKWDAGKYLKDYDETMKSHEAAVKKQIADFQKVFEDFKKYVDNFNETVDRLNAGEDLTLPPRPVKPVPPEAIKIPEILANPRSSKDFSREEFQKSAVEKYLTLPDSLSI